MMRPICFDINLVTVPALAQGGAPQGVQQQSALGQTGTMYDGNNANLQLAPKQNVYWAQLWAQPRASGNFGHLSPRRRRRRHVSRRHQRRRRALTAAIVGTSRDLSAATLARREVVR